MSEEDIRARLEAIAEELADLAMDALRQAIDEGGRPERERRLTRARRSVERAVSLLGDSGDPVDGGTGDLPA